jgi:hypothetical protein
MNKKNIVKLIITGTLALVLILLVINSKYAVKNAQELRKKTLYAPELTLVQKRESDRQNVLRDSQDRSQVGKFTYKKLEEKSMSLIPTRDPFSNLPMTIKNESSSNTLSLSGIFSDGQKSRAIINGMIVKVGDKVRDCVIVSIEQDRVILNDGSKDFELRLDR